eukprot:scaffold4500_cov326-Chaetoceros_neogracile.AAC.3
MAKRIMKSIEHKGNAIEAWNFGDLTEAPEEEMSMIPSPDKHWCHVRWKFCGLRQFPLYLRLETAQGIFIDFKNGIGTSTQKIPFGIAQIGKAFRNEITP